MYKQFAGSTRIMRVAGQNKRVETFYFSSRDITSDEVIFSTENELSYTPAQKKTAIYELIGTGLLSGEDGKIDKRTKTKILEILGFGSVDNARDIQSLHIGRAEQENLDMLSKKEASVSTLDDHEIHIAEHTAFILSQEMECKDESLRERVTQHICEHQNLRGGQNEQIT